jgi:hypothetical protein
MIRMMLFESISNPELREYLLEGPMQAISRLREYFSQRMKDGSVRPGDPELLAEALVSQVFGYAVGIVALRDQADLNAMINNLHRIINTVLLPSIEAKHPFNPPNGGENHDNT